MKTRQRNILLVVGGVLLLAVIIAANLARGGGGSKTAVQAADVKRGSVSSTVRAPGRIQPVTQVKLSANVPGEVARARVGGRARGRALEPPAGRGLLRPDRRLAPPEGSALRAEAGFARG